MPILHGLEVLQEMKYHALVSILPTTCEACILQMRNAKALRCWVQWPKFVGRRNQSQKHQASRFSCPSRRKPLSWLPSWLSSWSPLWLRWSHLLTACFLEPSLFRPRGTDYVISLLFTCITPGFHILHYLPEFAQTHVHWIDDAIQLSHPLSPTSPPALNLSQHQGVGPSYQLAKVLELQHQSFQWIFRVDFLQDWLVWFDVTAWRDVTGTLCFDYLLSSLGKMGWEEMECITTVLLL